MVSSVVLVLLLTSFVNGRPSGDVDDVIKVSRNCPPDQGLLNGKCYDVSLVAKLHKLMTLSPQTITENMPLNVAIVPGNCPPGQQLVNGACRNIFWILLQKMLEDQLRNVITVPPNCLPGQEFINGQCRDIFFRLKYESKNVVTVPPNCLPGQVLINGQCRDIFLTLKYESKNVVTVPPNCLPGQVLINGQCRDIFLTNVMSPNSFQQNEKNDISDLKVEANGKNIINVPSQCPKGFRPDAHGICRPILGDIL